MHLVLFARQKVTRSTPLSQVFRVVEIRAFMVKMCPYQKKLWYIFQNEY